MSSGCRWGKGPVAWLVAGVLLLVAVAGILFVLFGKENGKDVALDYTGVMTHLRAGEVESVTFDGARLFGVLHDGRRFRSDVPNPATQAALADRFAEAGVQVAFAPQGGVDGVQVVISVFMAASLCGVLVVVLKKNPGVLGRESRRAVDHRSQPVRFLDVDGVDAAKQELEEVVQFLKTPERYTRLGGRIPRGLLLVGPPGTGKTLLARAVAGEAGVPFFSMSGSEFVEMYVGVGARRVRGLFAQARKAAPCIVFIDEIDAIGRRRGGASSGHNEEREQALNQLLVEMDGFDPRAGIVVLAATNRHDVLDGALLRPGRFDRRVTVDRPDVRGRERILGVHTRGTPLAPSVDLRMLARGTPGFSGADLANLVNEAALAAARQGHADVRAEDFEAARDKVMMGAERPTGAMPEADRIRIAVHEAGHAIVARRLPDADPVHKVSIIPRGMGLGVTLQLPEQDHLLYSREYLESQIAVLMAGRVAEAQMLGSFGSGSANDIERATSMARKMVRQLGMSALGPVVCLERRDAESSGEFLSEYSAQTEQRIDEEVEKILKNGLHRAGVILAREKAALARLRDALLEEETVEADRLALLVK